MHCSDDSHTRNKQTNKQEKKRISHKITEHDKQINTDFNSITLFDISNDVFS
jgi:hypothetical protein